jgi:hypothetical protein
MHGGQASPYLPRAQQEALPVIAFIAGGSPGKRIFCSFIMA